MTNQNTDERVNVDEVPVVVAVEYHNDPADFATEDFVLAPGLDPFILFRMKQQDGVIVLDVTASMIEGEDELIETLEVFFETMIEERLARQHAAAMAELGVIEGDVNDVINDAVDEYLDEQAREANDV